VKGMCVNYTGKYRRTAARGGRVLRFWWVLVRVLRVEQC